MNTTTVTVYMIQGKPKTFTFNNILGTPEERAKETMLNSLNKQIRSGSVIIDDVIIPTHNIAKVTVK